MRAAVLALLLAVPATADDVCLPKDVSESCYQPVTAADGENAVVCYGHCDEDMKPPCLVIEPATGAVVGGRSKAPDVTPRVATSADVMKALERCGDKCRALRTGLGKREELTAAIDPTGKLLFEIEHTDRSRGALWSLKTGRRVSRFLLDDFQGPPPPASFDAVEIVGRHAFVGDPGDDYRLSYDIYTGAMDVLFQPKRVIGALVIEVDGMGRVDLRDYAQANAPLVATRRIKSHVEGEAMLAAQTIVFGDRALVVIQDPAVTVLVDARKRTVSKVRPLPRCK